jgi:hypothetical protein
VTGVVLTKLDGSAKGGIAVAIAYELGLPVKLVGVGEGLDDLRPFDPADEGLDDAEVDVRLEQREPVLAHRLRDVLLGQAAAALQVAEGSLELVGERVEHGRPEV